MQKFFSGAGMLAGFFSAVRAVWRAALHHFAGGVWIREIHFAMLPAWFRRFIYNNQLNFQVTNAGLGGDPAPGQVKQLRIQVRSERGEVQTMTFRENDMVSLAIGNGGGGGWPGGRGEGSLSITRARYGSGNRMRDVTGLLNSQIQNGHIGMRVGNDSAGRRSGAGQPGRR